MVGWVEVDDVGEFVFGGEWFVDCVFVVCVVEVVV